MADVRDPSVPSSQPGAPGPPPKKPMSTGVKIAIGCGILAALVIIVLVVMTVAGGMFLRDKAEDFTGGLEAQEEASQTIRELEQEHPFSPPADGVVGEDRADRFLAVTDDAWDRMRESMEEVAEREREMEQQGGAAGFGDAMAGMQALGDARVALAEALAGHDMPVSEYLWTGTTLVQAYASLDLPPEQTGVRPENLEIARERRAELADIAENGNEDAADKSVVLGMAWTWAMSEGVAPEAIGWDTLGFGR